MIQATPAMSMKTQLVSECEDWVYQTYTNNAYHIFKPVIVSKKMESVYSDKLKNVDL